MDNIERWLFLLLILGWMLSLSTGAMLGGVIHLAPLIAVCILANRIRRCSSTAEPVRAETPAEPAKAQAAAQ